MGENLKDKVLVLLYYIYIIFLYNSVSYCLYAFWGNCIDFTLEACFCVLVMGGKWNDGDWMGIGWGLDGGLMG